MSNWIEEIAIRDKEDARNSLIAQQFQLDKVSAIRARFIQFWNALLAQLQAYSGKLAATTSHQCIVMSSAMEITLAVKAAFPRRIIWVRYVPDVPCLILREAEDWTYSDKREKIPVEILIDLNQNNQIEIQYGGHSHTSVLSFSQDLLTRLISKPAI